MRSGLKFFVVLLILMVTFGLPMLLQQVLNPTKNTATVTPTPTEVAVVDDIRYISVPPILVSADSTFVYKVLATSLSGSEVTLSVLAKPDWVSWIPETQQLTGTVPSVGGVFTITVRAATIAGDVQDQTFTVTIDTPEADVKGAKTVAIWQDPFHPNSVVIPTRNAQVLPDATTSELEEVLGESTVATAQPILSDRQQTYLLLVVGIVLIFTVGSILVKIMKNAMGNRSKLPKGIVIERGHR